MAKKVCPRAWGWWAFEELALSHFRSQEGRSVLQAWGAVLMTLAGHLGVYSCHPQPPDPAAWAQACLGFPHAQGGPCRPARHSSLLPALPPQVKRLLKKQVVRIMSCSPDTQCSRHHSMEDPGRKGGAKAKSETGSASPEETPDGSASPVEMQDEGPEEAQEASEQLPPFLLKEGGDDRLHSAEQDADDEAADDTDDTSSVTSSASSTTSSQSGSGTSRKKSIPLSIKNLKRKHKRKKNKITRDFKPGDRYTQGAHPPS